MKGMDAFNTLPLASWLMQEEQDAGNSAQGGSSIKDP
jgi:hypothetical protein